ncbi:MAG: hypothetical protein ND866_17110, partial [Pyrinomonadaceae bacterium]|nr:hypothetical protein [Pyrinomonadaceae bacterium]
IIRQTPTPPTTFQRGFGITHAGEGYCADLAGCLQMTCRYVYAVCSTPYGAFGAGPPARAVGRGQYRLKPTMKGI